MEQGAISLLLLSSPPARKGEPPLAGKVGGVPTDELEAANSPASKRACVVEPESDDEDLETEEEPSADGVWCVVAAPTGEEVAWTQEWTSFLHTKLGRTAPTRAIKIARKPLNLYRLFQEINNRS